LKKWAAVEANGSVSRLERIERSLVVRHHQRCAPLRISISEFRLMRQGEVEANLVKLNETFRLPQIPDLIARKLAGAEKSALDDADMAFDESEYERLRSDLQAAHEASHLPEVPGAGTREASMNCW
jgi:predicted nucleotidyltransferase